MTLTELIYGFSGAAIGYVISAIVGIFKTPKIKQTSTNKEYDNYYDDGYDDDEFDSDEDEEEDYNEDDYDEDEEYYFDDYEQWSKRWELVWSQINPELRKGWMSPWIPDVFKDGNPIFSAFSPGMLLAIRIVQSSDPGFIFYNDVNKFSELSIHELVISCGRGKESFNRAAKLLSNFLEKERGSKLSL